MRILIAAIILTVCLSLHTDHHVLWISGFAGTWRLAAVNGRPVSGNFKATFGGNQFSMQYCNSIRANYNTVGLSGLKFDRTISTRMACMGQNPPEGTVTEAIERTATYRVVGSKFDLYDRFRRPTLSFIR